MDSAARPEISVKRLTLPQNQGLGTHWAIMSTRGAVALCRLGEWEGARRETPRHLEGGVAAVDRKGREASNREHRTPAAGDAQFLCARGVFEGWRAQAALI